MCRCHYRRIEDVQGRLDDTFFIPKRATVHPRLFMSALARELNVVEYQMRQTPFCAAISLVCNGEINEELLQAELIDGLTKLGLKDPEIRISRALSLTQCEPWDGG